MKLRSQLASALVFLYAVITLTAAPNNSNNHNTINAVLGDVSFVKKFGKAPNEAINERLRIQTHLAYVEALLRKADVANLSPQLRERRAALLDKLHDYRLAGEFPTNLDFPQERRPCFIDAVGNICAVGYLIEQTAGRALAEHITAAHQYDFLADMKMPELTAWVEASGLTARECAMIQPTYGYDFDRYFRIGNISPSVTTPSVSPFTIQMEVIAIPQRANVQSSFYIEVWSSFRQDGRLVRLNRNLSLYRSLSLNTILTSSATLGNVPRQSGQINFIFPGDSAQLGNLTDELSYEIFLSVTLGQIGLNSNSFRTSTSLTMRVANSTTSTRDLTLPSPITISPNPTNDVCMLALPENELHRVRLTNSLGTAVATLSDATGTTALDVSGLAAGVYFVEVESRTTRRRWVQKMVKY